MAENLKGCWVPCKSSWAALRRRCREQHVWCRALGVPRRNRSDFEVEYLCDYKRVRDEEFYLVKWQGYPSSSNTWEPRKNLRCRGLLKQLHQDLARVPGGPARPGPRGLPARAASYLVQKAQQRQALQRWERLLNSTRSHRGRIVVENEVDLHGPPRDFVYINEYKVGAGVNLVPVAAGCECGDCLAEAAGGCCPGASSNKFAYNEAGQVCVRAGLPIYECNSHCRCGADCPNRVVQRGIRYDLCIFRTSDGRGWGVRTLQRIRKNSFVMEYVGEIITSEEAERRGQVYDRQGATYLFDLDYVEDVYTVDAAHYGNISHFVNHSCDPNLQVYNVFIESLDERLPRIALFATRPIRAGEELTFDYNMRVDPVDAESTRMDSNFGLSGASCGSPRARRRIECKCGAAACRKFLF
ncbi:histone-lysine N-methyltransferase SUV39H1 [Phaenicophaeus curvirostris]|uniref:histone-lysine N-methyltransferase SUV39H1 n=1 Tax=Phaenicophaeus curvirostris TaxID=33595 RepID=UPI0037F0EE14